MLDFLDKLKKKPTRTREQIAIVVTGVFSFVILSIWANTWDIGREASVETKPEGKAPAEIIVHGISRIKEQGKSIWDETLAQVGLVGTSTTFERGSEAQEEGTTTATPDNVRVDGTGSMDVYDVSNE